MRTLDQGNSLSQGPAARVSTQKSMERLGVGEGEEAGRQESQEEAGEVGWRDQTVPVGTTGRPLQESRQVTVSV